MNKPIYKPVSFEEFLDELWHVHRLSIDNDRSGYLVHRVVRGLLFCQDLPSSQWALHILKLGFVIQADTFLPDIFAKLGKNSVDLGFRLEEPKSENAKVEYAYLQMLWKKGAGFYATHMRNWAQVLADASPKKKVR